MLLNGDFILVVDMGIHCTELLMVLVFVVQL